MKHRRTITVTAILLCALALTGCQGSVAGQNGENDTAAQSQEENETEGGMTAQSQEETKTEGGTTAQRQEENGTTAQNREETGTDGEEQNPQNLDEMQASAVLIGSVSDFRDGSFRVVPEQSTEDTAIQAAAGYESGMDSTTVSYGEDCLFQIASISTTTGEITLKDASAADVKKSTGVAVYGDTQENGEIHAVKVLITRYQ